MDFNIKCKLEVDGRWWPIEITGSVKDSNNEKKGYIKRYVNRLALQGFYPGCDQDGPPALKNAPKETPAPADEPNMSPNVAATLLTPICKEHHTDMKPSKVQKATGYTMFYCTDKDDKTGQYCRHRAKVNEETAVPEFWEVKK